MQITCAVFTENGTNLITGGSDKRVIVWDLVNMKLQSSFDFAEEVEALNYFRPKKHPSATFIAVAGHSNRLTIFDLSGENELLVQEEKLDQVEILKIM